MHRTLPGLQQGLITPHKFKEDEVIRRSLNLELSRQKDIEQKFTGSVHYLDLEESENRYLLSGCSDGSIYIHDLHNFSGKLQYTAHCVAHVRAQSKYAHSNSVECTTWFPSDNRLFISSGGDSKLKLWDANLMKPVDTFVSKGRIYHHQCSWSSRAQIAVGSHVNVAELVDLRTGHTSHELRGHAASVMAVAWSPRDAFLLATGGMDSRAILWDVRSAGGPLYNLDWNGAGTAHSGLINALAFTPDGLHLLTLGFDLQLRLWESDRGRPLLVNFGRVRSKALRHLQLAVGSGTVYIPSKGWVRVLDLWTGETKGDLSGHFNRVNCCVFREVYQELYSGGSDHNVLVWTAEGPSEADCDGNENAVLWSSDEELV